jgi:hypothetical protein
MYQNVAEHMMVPRSKKSWKFMNMYHWMSELVHKHYSTMLVIEYTYRTVVYSDFDCRHRSVRRIQGDFPRLETFSVKHDIPFTGVTVELLHCMTCVTHVCVRGALDMTKFDNYYKGEVCPADEESVTVTLPPSV